MECNNINTQFQSQTKTQIQIQKSAKNQSLQLVELSIKEHLDDFWEFWKEERGVVWSTKGTQETREEALKLMKFILPKTKDNPEGETEESVKFAIVLKVEGDGEGDGEGKPSKCVGMVGTNRHSPQGLELGYMVNPNYWGNGYATWGLTEFLRTFWGMEERSHIPHLVAKVDPRNKASERIAMKAGARKGELLEKYYSRRIDEGKKSDARCWYFDRPRSNTDEKGNMVQDGEQVYIITQHS